MEKLSRMDTDEQRRLLTSGERRRRDLQAASRTSLGSISKQAQPSTSGLWAWNVNSPNIILHPQLKKNSVQESALHWPCMIEIALVDLECPYPGSYRQEIFSNRAHKVRLHLSQTIQSCTAIKSPLCFSEYFYAPVWVRNCIRYFLINIFCHIFLQWSR